jgi:hypothetical protein
MVGKRETKRVRPSLPWVGAFVLLGVVLGIAAWKLFLSGEGPSEGGRTIAVVDFSDLAHPDDLSSSTTLTSLVNTALTEHSPIRVISPSYLQDIRRRLFGSNRRPITADQALEVARRAGATLLLSGEIAWLGEVRHVMWRLTDTRSGESLEARRVQGEDLIASADLIVGGLVPLLGSPLGTGGAGEVPSVTALTTRSEQAYKYLLAGLLAREEDREQDELHAFERAVAIDTTFALAFYELSRFYGREHGLARVYSDKAWSLRSQLGFKDRMRLEAWRAWVDYRVKDTLAIHREMSIRWPDDREILKDLLEKLYANWYHEEAFATAERGCEFYPEDDQFTFYRWLGLAKPGRMDEALAVAKDLTHKRADLAVNWDNLGWQYFWMGLPDSSEVAFHHSLAIDPRYAWSEYGLAICAYARGDLDGAIETLQQILARKDLTLSQQFDFRTLLVNWSPGLAMLLAEEGRFAECFAVIEETKRYATNPESELRYVTVPRLFVWLGMGRAAEVLNWTRVNRTADRGVIRLQAVKYEALALVALDSLNAAKRALDDLRATEDYWGGYTQYMVNKITAMIALAENDPDEALAALQELGRYGPIGSMYDIEYRELLARAYRLASQPEAAAAVHRELLQIYGGHALSHYELGQIYEEMERLVDAEQEYSTFLEMWARADEGLPQVGDAKERLAALRSRL